MIKSIPAVGDETIVLPLFEIGEIAAFARRSGSTWFLAVLNGPDPRTVGVPLAFLGSSQYRASVIRDRKEDSGAVQIETTTARNNDSWTLELAPGGGFIVRFSK